MLTPPKTPARRDDGLRRAPPSAHGVDGRGVAAFLDAVEAAGLDLHSLMLHRGGAVVAEAWKWPYGPDRPRVMHSVAKSWTASAIGLAIADGRIRLDDRVIDFFPEAQPTAGAGLAAMTVEDLLTMRSGHAAEVGGPLWRRIDASWIQEFFRIPVAHLPGGAFVYTSAASYMLAAILQRTTGETLHDYLKPRLFAPMGIEGERWDLGPDGFNPGGNGFTGVTADILKLGVLHAQGGLWEGQRLLPEAWVHAATAPHADEGRYGYHWVTYPNGAYGALGMFVQLVIVLPQHDATLAVTAAIDGSDKFVPLVFEHLAPAFSGGGDAGGDAVLADRLARFAAAPRTARSARPWTRPADAYVIDPNDAGVREIGFEAGDRAMTLRLTDAEGTYAITAGFGRWVERRTDMPGQDLHHGYRLRDTPVIATARWLDAGTLAFTWIFAETAFVDTVICRFQGERLQLERSVNINSAARAHPPLTGRAAT